MNVHIKLDWFESENVINMIHFSLPNTSSRVIRQNGKPQARNVSPRPWRPWQPTEAWHIFAR